MSRTIEPPRTGAVRTAEAGVAARRAVVAPADDGRGRFATITIDGPSAAGKSTLGLSLAQTLGWDFIDSGLLYRALAAAAGVDRLTSSDRGEIDQVVARLNPAVENGRLHLDAVPASGLKEPWIAERASRIAACAEVRQVLTDRLRRLVAERDCVLSGRDGGSAICPAATLKFFLTASPEVRATRRSGSDLSRRSAAEQNNRRDRRDSDRVSAPLLVPAGAIVLDTSNETQAETLLKLVGFVRANDPANARACL